jgi:hypothetical protein
VAAALVVGRCRWGNSDAANICEMQRSRTSLKDTLGFGRLTRRLRVRPKPGGFNPILKVGCGGEILRLLATEAPFRYGNGVLPTSSFKSHNQVRNVAAYDTRQRQEGARPRNGSEALLSLKGTR